MSKHSSQNGYEFPTYSLSVSFLSNGENGGKEKMFYFLQKMTKRIIYVLCFIAICNAVIQFVETMDIPLVMIVFITNIILFKLYFFTYICIIFLNIFYIFI